LSAKVGIVGLGLAGLRVAGLLEDAGGFLEGALESAERVVGELLGDRGRA
jgi:hypothetical protein